MLHGVTAQCVHSSRRGLQRYPFSFLLFPKCQRNLPFLLLFQNYYLLVFSPFKNLLMCFYCFVFFFKAWGSRDRGPFKLACCFLFLLPVSTEYNFNTLISSPSLSASYCGRTLCFTLLLFSSNWWPTEETVERCIWKILVKMRSKITAVCAIIFVFHLWK